MKELRCLYLSKNLINKIENVNNLSELIVLDLHNNRLLDLNGISYLTKLDNLRREALRGLFLEKREIQISDQEFSYSPNQDQIPVPSKFVPVPVFYVP